MKIIDYACVITVNQQLDSQLNALKQYSRTNNVLET